MFRVQAINELGLSDESQESAPLTVKAALSNAKYLLTTADVNHDNCPKPFHFKELKLNTVLTATPSAPYNIALLYCDGHSMILNWKKPLRSGGAKIKEYYVDKRRRGTTMWREVHIPPITERVYKVFGLFL